MEYEDRLTIPTPEGVDVDLVIAGLGSRFMAFLVDAVIQLLVIVALQAGGSVFVPGAVVLAMATFSAVFVYPVLFEVLAHGRTPGKMATGLRVVQADGSPVRFVSSAVRNVLRLIDLLPAVYTVGTIAVLATERNQRVGDIAAGTIVVRVRTTTPVGTFSSGVGTPAALPADAAGWDLTAVTAEELATLRAFLERRPHLEARARVELATDLATRVASKVVGPPTQQGPEHFLEQVVAAKSVRR